VRKTWDSAKRLPTFERRDLSPAILSRLGCREHGNDPAAFVRMRTIGSPIVIGE
jgi:hypothetical protein